MPRLFFLVLFATSTLVSSGQPAAGRALRILFIGNRLTSANNLPSIVESLAEAEWQRPITRTVAIGAFSLEDHCQQGTSRRKR